MTEKETAALLSLFQAYWPTFQVKPGEHGAPSTIKIWAQAIERYSRADCMAVLETFRDADPRPVNDRQYAPSASHFCGALKERHRETIRQNTAARKALEMGELPVASPEKLLDLRDRIKALVVAKSMPKLRPEDCGPNEDYDWADTIGFIQSLPSQPEKRRRRA